MKIYRGYTKNLGTEDAELYLNDIMTLEELLDADQCLAEWLEDVKIENLSDEVINDMFIEFNECDELGTWYATSDLSRN